MRSRKQGGGSLSLLHRTQIDPLDDWALAQSIETLSRTSGYERLTHSNLKAISEAKALRRIGTNWPVLPQETKIAELLAGRALRAKHPSNNFTAALLEALPPDLETPLQHLNALGSHALGILEAKAKRVCNQKRAATIEGQISELESQLTKLTPERRARPRLNRKRSLTRNSRRGTRKRLRSRLPGIKKPATK